MSWKDNTIMFWDTDVSGGETPPLSSSPTRVKVSDHSRGELDVSVEPIEVSRRMANGRLRKYVVARKRSFSVSWELLPSRDHATNGPVDGGLSGEAMRDFYNNNEGEFWVFIRDGDMTETAYKVVFTEFSVNVVKRGPTIDLWNVSLTLEEV